MRSIGRRRFLAWGLVGTAGAACGACSAVPPGARGHVLPDAPRVLGASPVAIVRPEEHETLAAAVARVVALAGGLGFVRPGDTVCLKPAVNSARRYPATTDPEVVLAVARLVKEAGGRPFVADRTMFLRSTREALERTGIAEAARAAGIPCLALEDADVVGLRHPLAAHWPDATLRLYRPVVEADHVVNLCTPRTHKLAGFTMSMKNAVGVVVGSARLRMHLGAGFHDRLAEISLALRPSLILLDGRQGFAAGGPDEGDLVRPGFLAAGTDPLAVDAIGLAHLRIAGASPTIARGSIWELPVMRRAAEIGVGAARSERIRLVGPSPTVEARIRRELA